MNKLQIRPSFVKKIFSLGLIILIFLSLYNIIDTNSNNSYTDRTCGPFLNVIKADEVNKKDIYVFPEIQNILCLNRISNIEQNSIESITQVNSNSKIINYILFIIFFTLSSFSSKLSKKEYLLISIFYFLLISFNFYYSINFFSLNIFLFFLFLNQLFEKRVFETSKKNISFKKSFHYFCFLLYFFLILLTQFSTHNYETLDWDINSYLVTSLDISNGYLPYEFHYENKPPFLFYIYFLFSIFSNSNLMMIKIFNDLFLLITVFMLHLLISNKTKDKLLIILGPLIFIFLMSKDWFHPGYSEIHALVFLSSSLIFLDNSDRKYKIILSGLLFSLTTLTNLGTLIFIFPILTSLLMRTKKIINLLIFIFGFIIPQSIFLFIYSTRGLLKNYILAMYYIPRNYPRRNTQIFNEFGIFVQDFSNYSFFIYLVLLILFSNFVYLLIKEKRYTVYISDQNFLLFLFSLLYYFLASMAYQHHLIFALFFISYLVIFLKGRKGIVLIIFFTFLSFINISEIYEKSYQNIKNRNEIVDNYPLNRASRFYFDQIKFDDKVLALDNYLILYYLDKENISYISHPSLYKEEFVINPLSDAGLVSKNEIKNMLEQKPTYVICSNFTQECNDLIGYIEVDTSEMNNGDALHYYQKEKGLKIFLIEN
jgi:hypothetical protein